MMHEKLKKEKFAIRSLVAPCYSKPSFNSSKISEATFGEQLKVVLTGGVEKLLVDLTVQDLCKLYFYCLV